MSKKKEDTRIVTFSEAWGQYEKGEHAMHKSVAEVLVKKKAPVKVAKVDWEKLYEKIKAKKAEQIAKQEKADKS